MWNYILVEKFESFPLHFEIYAKIYIYTYKNMYTYIFFYLYISKYKKKRILNNNRNNFSCRSKNILIFFLNINIISPKINIFISIFSICSLTD